MKPVNKVKKRCVVYGCKNFKLKNDERCLKHIYNKYSNVWFKNYSSSSIDTSGNDEVYS